MAIIEYAAIFMLSISMCFANSMNIHHVDADNLLWAPPSSLKIPYVTFINDFNRPTWYTRHVQTKRKGDYLHLRLPKTIPFAVVCGACFQESIFTPNLTISISDHSSKSVRKTRRDKSFQYNVGVNVCLMTYMITEPIQKGGTITCTLNRGKQIINEVISFDAVEADIQEPSEELEIEASDSSIELQCPQQDEPVTRHNPTINVWHEDIKGSKKAVGSPIISTKPTIHLDQPKYTTTVVCSVYNILNPSTVRQTRYKIKGSRPNATPEFHISGENLILEGHEETLTQKIKLPTSILTIIILAAVVVALLAFLGTYRFIAAARHK